MSIITNDKITVNNINDGFSKLVISVILDGAYDSNNVPMDGSYYCIPLEILGNKNALPTPSVGISGTAVTAKEIYDNLVSITTTLTRVGTFSYIRTYKTYDSKAPTVDVIETKYELSGTALFNDFYIKTLATVKNDDVVSGKVISASSINNFFANLLTAWKNTEKHHNIVTNETCHSVCYSDCHSDCHSDCNCYK